MHIACLVRARTLISLLGNSSVSALWRCLLLWGVSVLAVQAQPAVYSSETGILDVPAIVIDGQRVISETELQILDQNNRDFRLVDYKLPSNSTGKIKEFTLAFNDSVSLDPDTTLTFIAVLAESRCPLDVLCITAGEVTVILRAIESLADGNTRRTDFGLTLGGLNISDHYHAGRWYRLAEANPYPVSTEETTEEDYVIRVEHSRIAFK